MDTRGAGVLGGCVVLGACIIVAALIATRPPGPAAPPPSEVGRFQLVHRDGSDYVLDTKTGLLRPEAPPPARGEAVGWRADTVRPMGWREDQSWREVKPDRMPRPPGK
jgi:hypothetical protein